MEWMRRKKDDEEKRLTVVDSMGLWMRMDIKKGKEGTEMTTSRRFGKDGISKSHFEDSRGYNYSPS